MNTTLQTRLFFAPALLVVLAGSFCMAQSTPEPLTQAYALEKEGKPAAAIVALQHLLSSNSLDAAGSGKAWNILGLAYADQSDFARAEHAYENALRILEQLPANHDDYAMALDDFGGLYLTTGQLEIANKLQTRAFELYKSANNHAGMSRASSHLAGAAFSQNNVQAGSRYLQRATKEARLASDLADDDRAAIASLNGWQAQLKGNPALSIAAYRESLNLLRKQHGEEHPFTGWGYLLLGNADAADGQYTPALEEMRHGLAILGRTMGDQNPHYLTAELAYSRVLDTTGSHAEAARIRAVAEPLLKNFYRSQCAGCTVSVAALR